MSELRAEYARAGGAGETQLGGYLKNLIERYEMVKKPGPVFATGQARKARYAITDNFLLAWLHAIQRNVRLSRVRPIHEPVARAEEMLKGHEGHTFEKMVHQLTEEASSKGVGDFQLTDLVHGYWNKPNGSDIEIDMVAVNEDREIIRFGSCKRSEAGHSEGAIKKFEKHVGRFLKSKEGRRLTGWTVEMALYTAEFGHQRRRQFEAQNYVCLDLNDFRKRLYG